MELYDVMRTTFSAREFTDDPVPDAVLHRLFENARFASSGGNRQGWRVIVTRDPATKSAIAALGVPASQRYFAQSAAGEGPWNPIEPTKVPPDVIAKTVVPPVLIEPTRNAPVLLIVCVDLRVVAAVDQDLDRIAVVPGASIYPFVWNILLAARNEGLGGTLTTMPIGQEPSLKALLGIPSYVGVAAILPMGRPKRQLVKLTRKPVHEIVWRERWEGTPFDA